MIGLSWSTTSHTLTFIAASTWLSSSNQNATNSRASLSPRTTTLAVESALAWPTYSMPRSYWSLKKYGRFSYRAVLLPNSALAATAGWLSALAQCSTLIRPTSGWSWLATSPTA